MADASANRIPLAAAISSLRQELLMAWNGADGSPLRFRVAPVELTLEVAVTQTGTGSAGINWWLIDANAEVTKERAVTQSIKLTLDPVSLNHQGQQASVLIDGRDTPTDDIASSAWSPSLDGPDS